jgi:hypothetical protein
MSDVQADLNMTGTNCDLFTHNQSRSYLNHLVYQQNKPVRLLNLRSNINWTSLISRGVSLAFSCQGLILQMVQVITCSHLWLSMVRHDTSLLRKWNILVRKPIPVAERSKARVCGRSLAGVAGSNRTGVTGLNLAGGMDVCVVCFVPYGWKAKARTIRTQNYE